MAASPKPRVAHLTTVHPVRDARIFHKECRSLVRRGFEVHLVAAGAAGGEAEGVRITGVARPAGRSARMLLAPWHVMRAALQLKPDLFHFHDPELIPAGLLLRAMGKRVVYDIHEDFVTSIAQKDYLPRTVSRMVGRLFGGFERAAARAFACVLAERYYAERFPRGVTVLNYPIQESLPASAPRPAEPGRIRLLYTGGHWRERGGHIHANLVNLIPEAEVHLVGLCKVDWAQELLRIAGPNAPRLHIEGAGERLPYERILARYAEGGWTAGLAIFPPSENFPRKELTKLFEYMGSGIPVLCSHFPVWKELVEGNGCGLTVDPADEAQIVAAVRRLAADPAAAAAMGERGRKAVRERYNWELQADRLEAIYRKLLRLDAA
jgi:glycosyltransferase involved in cell wall biosynthesis